MAVNYVGNISILDRGDAPAQAILDRNARTLAKRVADETKEELGKVMKRVETIYGTYEWSQEVSMKTADVEYINDLIELEELIKDPVKMKKYQKQVTIFIVGYENVCGQKLRLLQQVNEFFMENASKIDDDDAQIKTPEIELDDMMDTIDDTLKRTEDLAQRLGDLNKEMVNYMYDYAQAKASTKSKKKLEKSLNQAKDDILSLNEKLQNLQQELEEREDRIQQMFKQIEVKNMECQRYKTAAEVAKKSAEEADSLREQLAERDSKIKEMRQELDRLQIDLGETNISAMLKDNRLQNAANESSTKISELQKAMEDQMINIEDAKRELQRLHEKQIEDMSLSHREEVEQLKNQHMEEVKRLLDQIEDLKEKLDNIMGQTYDDMERYRKEAEEAQQVATQRAASADVARQRLAEVESERDHAQADIARQQVETQELLRKSKELEEQLAHKPPPEVIVKEVEVVKEVIREVEVVKEITPEPPPDTPAAHPPPESPPKSANSTPKDVTLVTELPDPAEVEAAREETQKGESRQTTRTDGEDGEEADMDADKLSTKQSSKGKSLDPVEEAKILEFEDAFELDDEESWSSVPPNHLPGRFLQFRQLSKKKLGELENTLDSTVKKTTKKVNTLKAQFHEHKRRWESERVVLIEQIEQATKLHGEAEKEADLAMAQLEDFINEQEMLEQEEEHKRASLERASREPTMTLDEAEKNLQKTLDQTVLSEEALEERLLSQTDEAKLEEQAKEMSRKNTSLTDDEAQKVDGSTTEDLRDSVTRSRASLREQHKSALTQLKSISDERRSKSPKLDSSLLQRSELDDMDLDENGDIPFPPDNPSLVSMHDVATSPINFSRNATMKSEKSIPMAEHPIVIEFLKTYENIVKFKDTLGNMLMDKEMMSLGQVLTEIEPIPFEKEDTVQPQIEEMGTSIGNILEEVFQLISTVVANDREYPVSSLFGGLSRDPTRSMMFTREKMQAVPQVDPLYEGKSGSQSRSHSVSSGKDKLEELHEKYLELERNYQEDREKHESQLNHNTVVMMEMQDTIHNLQREISNLGHKAPDFMAAQSGSRTQTPPIMFTRLDSDRNAKVMKRAVNEQRLDSDKYKTAVEAMDRYVDIPSKRLVHLANKYAHHQQMRHIEDAVRQSSNLDENVFQILDKMEALQNERARRWAERMDSMGSERLELANFLMVTLDDIERESGIFLIKPMFSYRSPVQPNVYQGKLSRAYKPPRTGSRDANARVLVPTPASQTRTLRSAQAVSQSVPHPPTRKQDDPSSGVAGKQTELVGDYPKPTWNPFSASPRHHENDAMWAQVNTPRILELDINRMLIGQNQVSMSIPSSIPSHDRLANAANLSTRTYATLSRPTGHDKRQSKEHRPRSHTGLSEHSAPPTTPLRENTPGSAASSTKKVRIIEEPQEGSLTSRNLPATSPLPPIIKENTGIPLPPVSPPGSSLRQSPSYYGPQSSELTSHSARQMVS